MFKFDVYFRNIEVINLFQLEKHLYHMTPKTLTLHNGAGCCMYPCDVVNNVAS